MTTYLNLVQIVVSIVLIAVILLQTRGSSFSPTFSADSSIYRTRRGVERTLFNFTIALSAVFILLSILSALAGGFFEGV